MFHHSDGLILLADKGYRDRGTETWLNDSGTTVIRARTAKNQSGRGRNLLGAVQQSIESVNKPSKANSTLNSTAAGSSASPSESCNASSP